MNNKSCAAAYAVVHNQLHTKASPFCSKSHRYSTAEIIGPAPVRKEKTRFMLLQTESF